MPKRKPSLYNKLLKQFTKINDKLPEDRKLSISERRRIIREELKPKFKDTPISKVRVKDIKEQIYKAVEKIPPKQICDINYLDISQYAFVEWFNLDDTVKELVPDCIYIKISAGEYGDTNIFNTRNYDYRRKGVRSIVEAIREDAKNVPSGKFIFSAYKKLRPRKKNNGMPENYYLDFILFIVDKKGNQSPQAEAESVEYDVPKTRENKKIKTKIRNVIEDRLKKLKQKKDSSRRAKATLKRNIKKFAEKTKSLNKSTKPRKSSVASWDKQFQKSLQLLEKYYAEGKLTKKQYELAKNRILGLQND
jgi:hypothetical protein